MATGQIVSDLIVRLQAQGGQEVEYLRKELGQLQKVGKLTEEQLKSQVIAVKSLGKATAGTTSGLKAQIAAFEKIRGNARNTSNVYRDLTNDIRNLNRELKKQIDLETGVPGRAGGILGLLGGGAKQKTRRLYQEKQPKEDTLSYLLGTQYFGSGKGSERITGTLNEFSRRLEKLQRGFTEISWDDLSPTNQGVLRQLGAYPEKGGKKGRKFEQEARAAAEKAGLSLTQTGTLNKYQMQALGWEGNLDITSKPYLDLVTKITGEQQIQNHLLEKVNNRSAEELATQRARTRQIAAQNKLDVTHIKSSVYQDYVRGLELDARKNRKTSPATMFGMKGRDIDPETKRWQGIDAFWKTTSVIANKLLKIKGSPLTEDIERFDARDTGSLQKYWKTGMVRGSLFTQRKGDKPISLTKFYKGMPLDDQGIPRAPHGFGKSKIEAKRAIFGGLKQTRDIDPYGLGGPRQYDKTPLGIANKVRDLQQDLMALNPENEEWLQVTKELTAAEKELQAIVDKGTKRLKERRQEIGKKVAARSKNVYGQKLLPAAGGTSAGKMQRDIFLAGKDTGFSADQYGPQISSIQRATESQKQFIKRLQESVKAGKLNINTLSQQRAKLDEIRNGLDPTSAAFRRATKAIQTTDQALGKLNRTSAGKRFMGAAQGILGASFFGGPAGFLGATAGAGIQALRGQDNLREGAATGGLVASQVLQPIAGFGAESANYTAMIEKSKIALQAATRIEGDAIASKEAYAVALSTAAGVTERFNVPQELAARGMTRLSAAVIGAGGNIHNAGIAFENISAAIKATGGSTEDTKAAVTAMVQIFSKGRVSAEELSGQLGERFPAAVTLFAEANNMTTKELQKGLKDGAIGLDKLWNFVLKLGDKYKDVAEGIGAASVEAGVRSQIAWNEVKLAVGKALQPIGADLQVIGAEILTNLVPVLKFAAQVLGGIGRVVSFTAKAVVENFDKLILVVGTFSTTVIFANRVALAEFIKTLTVKLTAALKGVAASMGLTNLATKGFSGAMAVANKAVIAFTASLLKNPIIAVGTGMAIAASAAWHFGRQWQRTVKEIKDGKMTINEAKIEIAELEQALVGEEDAEARARLQTQIEMYKAAVKAKQEINKRANLEEANAFDSATPGDTSKWKEVKEHIAELGLGGKHVQEVFINAFKGMEDSLVSFVTTGKLKFKEFARSVIADIARMIIKQMMFNMLSGFVSNLTRGPKFTKGIGPLANPDAYGAQFPVSWHTGIPSGLDLKPGSFGISDQSSNIYRGLKGIKNDELNPYGNAKGNVFAKNRIVPYAKGGVVNRPTLFPFANGVGLMSEVGPEAIMPLKRGKGGRLGVEVAGGGGTTVNVSVDAKGTNVEGDEGQAKGLGKVLAVAIKAEISKQQRPGGMLYR